MIVVKCDLCGCAVNTKNYGGSIELYKTNELTHYDMCIECFRDLDHFIWQVQSANKFAAKKRN